MKFRTRVLGQYVDRRSTHRVDDLSGGAGSREGYADGGGPGAASDGTAAGLAAGREPTVSRARVSRLVSNRRRRSNAGRRDR